MSKRSLSHLTRLPAALVRSVVGAALLTSVHCGSVTPPATRPSTPAAPAALKTPAVDEAGVSALDPAKPTPELGAPKTAVANTALLSSGSVHYLDTFVGDPVVVLLHAGSGNVSLWGSQFDALSARGFRVVAYDRDDHGQSRRNTAIAVTAPAELDEFLQVLNLARVHLVGVAAGGGVALRYALNYPARVTSLVIANSIGDVQDAAYKELGKRLHPKEFHALPLELRELGPSYRASNPAGVQRWLDLSRSPMLAVTATPTTPATSATPATALTPPSRSPTRSPAPAMGDSASRRPASETPALAELPVTFARIATLSVPVLFLTGDADLYTPPAVLELFQRSLPQACLRIIRDSGHASFWENPSAFNATLLWFLAEQPRGKACAN